jgi:hypothetical protein
MEWHNYNAIEANVKKHTGRKMFSINGVSNY